MLTYIMRVTITIASILVLILVIKIAWHAYALSRAQYAAAHMAASTTSTHKVIHIELDSE